MKYFTFVCVVLMPLHLFALDDSMPQVRFERAFARATNGVNGAIFGVLHNLSDDQKLVLTGVTSPVCDHVELHTHKMVQRGDDAPVYRMVQIPEMSISPKDKRVLKPGGDHIMLMKLKKALKEGEEITFTLLFQGEAPLEMRVPVKSAGHKGGACHKHRH